MHWRVVCSRYGWPEVIVTDDPLRGGKLAAFMMYMCDETDLAGVSISNYVWALRAHMKRSRQLDPALGVAEWDDWSEAVQVQAWVPGEPRRMVPMALVTASLRQVDVASFTDVQAAVLLLMLLFFDLRRPAQRRLGGWIHCSTCWLRMWLCTLIRRFMWRCA